MAVTTALITGATGFTGRYVAEALARRGVHVHGWTHAEDHPDYDSVDLTDRDGVRNALSRIQPDVVVHLAAISFVAHGDAEAIYRANILGTRNLLEALACSPRPPSGVLLASSANIYGNAAGVLDESAPACPQNDYAISKLAMEHIARLWMDRLPITIVRPFNYTGVGQSEKFLLPKIVAHFRKSAAVIELGNLDVWRDFNDVRNVAENYARLVDEEVAGEVFNICSGNEYSLREVIGLMEGISGRSIEVRVNPEFVRHNEVARLRGDPGKLRALLGATREYSLAETLEWMYRSPPA